MTRKPPDQSWAMWLDEGRPWASFAAEQAIFNVPVAVSMAVKGP